MRLVRGKVSAALFLVTLEVLVSVSATRSLQRPALCLGIKVNCLLFQHLN